MNITPELSLLIDVLLDKYKNNYLCVRLELIDLGFEDMTECEILFIRKNTIKRFKHLTKIKEQNKETITKKKLIKWYMDGLNVKERTYKSLKIIGRNGNSVSY